MPEFKPGMVWHDLQQAAPIHQILADVKDSAPLELAVVARSVTGTIEVWGTHPNADAVLGLLQRGITWLAERDQLTEDGAVGVLEPPRGR